MKQHCLRSLQTHRQLISGLTNLLRCHQKTVDLVGTNGGRPTTSQSFIMWSGGMPRRGRAESANTSAGHNIQPGSWTKWKKTDRGDAYVQAMRCSPYCTGVKLDVRKPRGVHEHPLECEMTGKADKMENCTFVHPMKCKEEQLRPLVLRGWSGCVEVYVASRRCRPIAVVY